jgi:predicted O-linked N-acetylglucosamine transferase (SPINDLY family)
MPEVAAPPFVRQGHVTFGSFNTLKKVSAEVVRVWAQILQSVPDARLLLKSAELNDERMRERIFALFDQHGVAAARLELVSWIPATGEHMELYSHVDIGLDPFPYNGTATTCEALWMGVPVICLSGDRHAGRVGASIMHHAGLPELVAESPEAYVALACSLASNRQRLEALRHGLREQMQQSELMDLRRFTQALETAYRDMWVAWCSSGGGAS